MVVPTRVARETAQGRIDTSMIGRIWRRVMQIRGSAGVDLMARAQVRAHREPCGSLEKGRGGRTFHVVGTVRACDGPTIFSFFRFSSNLSSALLGPRQRARRNIRGSVSPEILFRSVVSITNYSFEGTNGY